MFVCLFVCLFVFCCCCCFWSIVTIHHTGFNTPLKISLRFGNNTPHRMFVFRSIFQYTMFWVIIYNIPHNVTVFLVNIYNTPLRVYLIFGQCLSHNTEKFLVNSYNRFLLCFWSAFTANHTKVAFLVNDYNTTQYFVGTVNIYKTPHRMLLCFGAY